MPTLVLEPGATIFVTGVNGLIGSVVADQLLTRGYNVRGAVRDVARTKWLKEYFDEKFGVGKFETVEVPDMTKEGCYDDLLRDIQGFIHMAAPVGGITDLDFAVNLGKTAGLNALSACSKTPSVKRFVHTSSSVAAALPKIGLDHEFPIDETTYNDEALELAKVTTTANKAGLFYAAMKSESEKAMWAWMRDNKPSFIMNSILPHANFGPVLVPSHQGFPSTIEWPRAAWTSENFALYSTSIPPLWFVSILDCALLHVSALVHGDVNSERLFAFSGRWDFNALLEIYRRHFPHKKFPENVPVSGKDMTKPPTARAEEVLKWVKGRGWDGLEETVVDMVKDW